MWLHWMWRTIVKQGLQKRHTQRERERVAMNEIIITTTTTAAPDVLYSTSDGGCLPLLPTTTTPNLRNLGGKSRKRVPWIPSFFLTPLSVRSGNATTNTHKFYCWRRWKQSVCWRTSRILCERNVQDRDLHGRCRSVGAALYTAALSEHFTFMKIG